MPSIDKSFIMLWGIVSIQVVQRNPVSKGKNSDFVRL